MSESSPSPLESSRFPPALQDGNATAMSYDRVTRARAGDMSSKEIPFRFFNNYVKKTLLQFALDSVRAECGGGAKGNSAEEERRVTVIDLCSGRGGDLGKWLFMQSPRVGSPSPALTRQHPARRWNGGALSSNREPVLGSALDAGSKEKKAGDLRSEEVVRATHYEGFDISKECIDEAERRYKTMQQDSPCSVMFKVADCFSDEFLSALRDRKEQCHIVSIQFAFHYACTSAGKVQQVVEALASCLVPGGVAVITTVDPFELSQRVREKKFGNAMFSIELLTPEPEWVDGVCDESHPEPQAVLAVGTGYHFRLKGFVDCCEYVVPIDFVRSCMADAHMEECPAVSKPFAHFLRDFTRDWSKNRGNTLTKAEEQLTTLYMSLVFRKRKTSGEEVRR